ncbi:MAG TPA: hypothetical protein VKT31_10990 [Solirubrobacteraceae bacterium]|nr:hypothetical protein [Solirubrobacteraceae bacterium]
MARSVSPGCVVVYPNREKATSKSTKSLVVLLLLVSVGLMLIVTVGGWSKLAGLKALDLVWCAVYLILAYYVGARWSRGGLTLSAALGILLLIVAVIAGTGLAGTSWFDRNAYGFAAPHTIFGGKGLGPDVLGLFTVLLIPVQALLIGVAMVGFSQSWNIETEAPIEEARKRGYRVPPGAGTPPPKPAAA